jgi:hypothetical protein
MNPLAIAAGNAVKHSLMRTVSVICTLLVMGGLGWAVYVTVIRPHTKGTFKIKQEAQQITNIEVYNPEDKFFVGVKIFGLKFGISKPTIKKISEITEEVKPK